jgi:hypothetical protein
MTSMKRFAKYRGLRWLLVLAAGTLAALYLISCQNTTEETLSAKRPADPWTGSPIYQDMTAASGVNFTYHTGEEAMHYAILESLGGGVGLIDYDGDGLLDIFVTGGGYYDGPDKKQIKGHPCRLYKNLGSFKFQDVTSETGLDIPWFYTHGVAVCDYDKDGWPDLLVTGYGGLALFRNVAGPGQTRRFVEVTKEAGLLGPHVWTTSAAWADFDGDGFADLYVCQYIDWSLDKDRPCTGYRKQVQRDVCPPRGFSAAAHRLYRNVPDSRAGTNGGRRFIDVAKPAGLRVPRTDADYAQLTYLSEDRKHALRDADSRKEYGKALGIVVVDVNNDARPDIFVANDTVNRFLYLNRSLPGKPQFEEVGMETGVATDDHGFPQGSMGVDAGDPYGTGLPALWLTNFEMENHALFRNAFHEGQLHFQFDTYAAGVAAIGQLFVGWGTAFTDVDNDGWEDIFIANGHVVHHPSPSTVAQEPVLFLNQGQGRFKRTKAGGSYFQGAHRGRGVAFGDLDNDGRPDVVISHVEEPVTLLRNVADAGNHWLGVTLATKDRRTLAGAKVVLAVNGRNLTRFVKGGGSCYSANDTRLLFGLGQAAKAGKLTVDWPTGQPRRESFDDLPIDRYHTLVQGTGSH